MIGRLSFVSCVGFLGYTRCMTFLADACGRMSSAGALISHKISYSWKPDHGRLHPYLGVIQLVPVRAALTYYNRFQEDPELPGYEVFPSIALLELAPGV